jgi:hypothetical protein
MRGSAPGDPPVALPKTVMLSLNLAAARMLGRTVSPTLLARAGEVIE